MCSMALHGHHAPSPVYFLDVGHSSRMVLIRHFAAEVCFESPNQLANPSVGQERVERVLAPQRLERANPRRMGDSLPKEGKIFDRRNARQLREKTQTPRDIALGALC